jgi:hypothetical protein
MPSAMSPMTDEVRKQDEATFAEAINKFNESAQVPLLNSVKNHEFARLKIAQKYPQAQPFSAYVLDAYAVVIFHNAGEMEHEAPKAPRQRDDSGDRRNNAHSSNNNSGISLSDLEIVKRKADAQKELTGLRQEQRVGILSPEKSARVAELQAILDDKGLVPIQKSEKAPLDINTPDADLAKPSVSVDQIKELIRRRKKEGWMRS